MRTLYARIVLWLIRPALEARKPFDTEAVGAVVIDTVLKDLRKNGPLVRELKNIAGDSSPRS